MMDVIKKITAEDVRQDIRDAKKELSKIVDIMDAIDITCGIELTRSGAEMIREVSITSRWTLSEVLRYLDNEDKKE